MKKNHIKLIFILAFVLIGRYAINGQVSGISYTISPSAEYVWWDNQAGLKDGVLLGGKLGIGFGEYLELRGNYMQSTGLMTDFSSFGLPGFSEDLYMPRKVNLFRYGGELKANLSKGQLLPFLTLGTGIQSIELDTFGQRKQIYLNAGAGIIFSIRDRYTLTVEGKNAIYNFNSGSYLLTESDKSTLGVSDEDFGVNRLRNNWGINASLQFYLGGRRPGQLSELDKAYMATFNNGLKGIGIPVEPALVKINFDDKLSYRDGWLFGGYTGIDFNPYIGVRGFYFRAMDDGQVSTDFDDLAMYGGLLRLKLNASAGLTPYLSLGGGKIHAGDAYTGKDSLSVSSQAFALGGAGIEVPVSNRFKIFGSVNALLTSGVNIEELQDQGEIQTSMMYDMGFRFVIGKKVNPETIYNAQLEDALARQQINNDLEAARLKETYESKIVELEGRLNEAYVQNDIEKAAGLLEEKEEAQKVVDELDRREQEKMLNESLSTEKVGLKSEGQIILSPKAFEDLIEEILENFNYRQSQQGADLTAYLNQQNADKLEALSARVAQLEQQLVLNEEIQDSSEQVEKIEESHKDELIRKDLAEYSAKLLLEIQKLNDKVDQHMLEIESMKVNPDNLQKDTVATEEEQNLFSENEAALVADSIKVDQSVTEGNVLGIQKGGEYILEGDVYRSRLRYEGMSGFAGFNLGGQTTFNVGLRWYYGIGNSKFELMPEAFFGFGSPSAFGLTVNGVYPITFKNSPVTPYLGVGTGFMQIAENGDDRLRLNYNLIAGSYINVFNGRLFIDFTARNWFKFNQVIAGYRFNF